jgi:hypothetical protein
MLGTVATVVRSRLQQEQAAPLFAPLRLPPETNSVDAVWSDHGDGEALGRWVERLLSGALPKNGSAVAHIEGVRDVVRYALEVAGSQVHSGPDGPAVLPGRRAAVTATVTAAEAHALEDSWQPGLTLALVAPADEPAVAVLRRPGGDLLVASTPALPASARKLLDQLAEVPPALSGPPPPDAMPAPDGRPSGPVMIVALAAISLVAIGIAALHAATSGSPAQHQVADATVQPTPRQALPGLPIRPPTSLPPVASGVIAPDPATGGLVLMGCCDDSGIRAGNVATWTWAGERWSHVPSRGTIPPFQRGLHLAYDDAIGAFVLQGGTEQSGTWIWARGSWAEVEPGPEPPAGATSMVFDPLLQELVLVVPDPADQLAQTWAWDGHTWAQIDSGGPTLNNPAVLAYDMSTQRLMLAGQDAFGAQVTTWTFTPVHTWRFDRVVTGFTYDPTMQLSWDGVSKRLIAVSLGPDAIPASGAILPVDTWTWDGKAWAQLRSPGAPTEQGLLVGTPGHRVLFVGVDQDGDLPDVWAWSGTNWTRMWGTPPSDGFGGIAPPTSAQPTRVP